MPGERRVIELGEPCYGNAGRWGRTVTYEVHTALGPMVFVDWENLPKAVDPGPAQPSEDAQAPRTANSGVRSSSGTSSGG